MKLCPCSRFILCAAVLFALAPASAQMVVVPGANATVEGDADNGYPFNIADFSQYSQRYQQVYAASEFASLSGPAEITQIAFRPDAGYASAFSATLPDIQINLSTTSASPIALSTIFADNVGANDTIVFARGPMALSSTATGPTGGPKDFDILINLTTPFLYDPSAGNLLMDVYNFMGGTTTQFDAVESSNYTARVVARNGVYMDTANLADNQGLVTRFTFGSSPAGQETPEPSTLAMLIGGGAPMGYLMLRRYRRK